jgi:hypothetical protein
VSIPHKLDPVLADVLPAWGRCLVYATLLAYAVGMLVGAVYLWRRK